MKLIIIVLFVVMMAFTVMTTSAAEVNLSPANGLNTTPLKVTVGDILEKGDSYGNQTVEIPGKITSQCGSGCWFILSDGNGDLYVTLKPNNFVIPPAMGKEVTVQGILAIQGNDVSLIGSSVVLDGKTYP